MQQNCIFTILNTEALLHPLILIPIYFDDKCKWEMENVIRNFFKCLQNQVSGLGIAWNK